MGVRYTWLGAGTSSTPNACFRSLVIFFQPRASNVTLRYTSEDPRTSDQVAAEDRVREDVERAGGAWAQLSQEQRERILARLRDKKQRAQAARARKQADQESLEQRVAKLEERIARLGG